MTNKLTPCCYETFSRPTPGEGPWFCDCCGQPYNMKFDSLVAVDEQERTPDAKTYDLGHYELMRLCVILDAAVTTEAEYATELRKIFTTDGTVSVTVRNLPN